MRQYKSNSAGKLTSASEIITHDRRRDKLRRVISVGLFFALNQTVLGKRTLVCRVPYGTEFSVVDRNVVWFIPI